MNPQLLRVFVGIGVLLLLAVYVMTTYETVRLSDGVRVELVPPTVQDGLPHTTGPHTIRMTHRDFASDRKDEILRHEYVHLWQKRDPAAWSAFYKDAWGYTLQSTPPEGIPQSYIQRLRPNPDTESAPWAIWRNRYVFIPVYRDASNRLRDPIIHVWDTETRRLVPLPDDWKRMFCDNGKCPHQYDHPHEIAAEFLTIPSYAPAAAQLKGWRLRDIAGGGGTKFTSE